MSSRFGEMLLNRRRELGMSIQQVANVIKIRPQIIEFFETGNFASMPPRGYAQGMIASYARYLGLNPREVVNTYFDELYVFERGGSSAGSQFTEGATDPVPRSVSTSGRYLMVDSTPPSSRYAQRPPQAGYVSDMTSGHVPMRVAGNERRVASLASTGEGRPRNVRTASGRRGTGERAGAGSSDMEVTARMRRSDLRDAARSGRGSRPRSGASRDGYPQRSRSRSSTRSRSGAPSGFPMDPRVMIGGLAIILILLALVIFLLVRSCSAPAETTPAGSAPVTQAQPAGDTASDADEPSDSEADRTDGEADDSTDADADADADASDGEGAAADAKPAEPVETKVTVSLDEGASSWLEVKVDGTIVLSEQVAGPYEVEYTPTSSVEITVDHPADVHVTKNGDSVDWDTKTSGVGKVTLTVPKTVDEDANGSDGADGSDAEQTGSDTSSDSTEDSAR